jgi:tetratricopeptide (TPR) repeat protein
MRLFVFLSCVVFPALLCAAPSAADEPGVVAQQSLQAEKLLDESRFDAAIRVYASAIPSLTATFGEAHVRTLIAINNYATALLQMNQGGEAETILRDALDRRQRAGLGEDDNLATTWSNLADALLMMGRTTASIVMHERALALRQRLYPDGHPEIAFSMTSLGEALRQSGELTRARSMFERAVELWAAPARGRKGAAAVPLMPGYARAKNSLGLLLDAGEDRKQAEESYLHALQVTIQAYGPIHQFTATLHHNLAGHYSQYSDWKRADEHCRKALTVYELRPGFHNAQFAQALQLHATILERLRGRKQEARAQRKRADAIMTLR